jgi:hypothetical protein
LARLIRNALREVDPETLEAVAEEIVLSDREFAPWFPSVTTTRVGGATDRGWPDGVYIDHAGDVNGFEATTAGQGAIDPKKRRTAVRGHLHDDLLKAEAGRVQGLRRFVFFANAIVPDPDFGDVRKEFDRLGIEAHFITGKALATRLVRPEHAYAARVLLGPTYRPKPFHYLDQAPILGKNEEDIYPLLEEYDAGLVGRSPCVDAVKAALSRDRFALVRSGPATGKSVVIAHVGLEHARETRRPVYYVDCETDVHGKKEDDAHEVFRERATEGALFVLDNIQADAQFVRDFAEGWLEESYGSSLLLVGLQRDDSTPDGASLGRVLGVLDRPITVEITEEDLIALYRRLARRAEPEHEAKGPTAEDVASWHTFEGDLITLTLALQGRLADRKRKDLVLAPEDAVDSVRQRYFPRDRMRVGQREEVKRQREALLDVAALGVLDLGPDHDLVSPDLLMTASRLGAVRDAEQGERLLSKTVHSNYARALLKAANEPEPIAFERLVRLAGPEGFPDLLWPIVRKLQTTELVDESERSNVIRRFLARLLPEPRERPSANLPPLPRPVGLLREALQSLRAYYAVDSSYVEFLALARPDQLRWGVGRADIRDLERVIEIGTEQFPAIATFMAGLLTEEGAIEKLIETSCLNGPTSMKEFLVSQDQTRLRPLVLRKLEEPGVATRVSRLLGDLADVGPFVACLRLELRRSDLARDVVSDVLTGPPEPHIGVVDSESAAEIAQTLLEDDGLQIDRGLIDRLVNHGGAAVVLELARSEVKRRRDVGAILAESTATQLGRLLGDLRQVSADVEGELIKIIPEDDWRRAHEARPMDPWDWYEIARRLREAHCQHLVRASAVPVLAPHNHKGWRKTLRKRDPMSALLFAFAAAHRVDAGVANMTAFLDQPWSERWLRRGHFRTRSLGLAASMFAAAQSLPEPFLSQVIDGGFFERVQESYVDLDGRGNRICKSIGLIGAAAATRRPFPSPTSLAKQDVFEDALRLFEALPLPPGRRLTYRTMTIWYGLRFLNLHTNLPFEIPGELATDVFDRWKRSKPPEGDRPALIKGEMLAWFPTLLGEASSA